MWFNNEKLTYKDANYIFLRPNYLKYGKSILNDVIAHR